VAMAAALNAERCEIYSDVDGVYTTDPNLIKKAKHIPEISYAQIQEMAEAGAKVLNAEAIQFAKKAKIALYARSTFEPGKETIIREMALTDSPKVIGIVQENEITRIIFFGKDIHLKLNEFFIFLETKNISVKELNYINDKTSELEKVSFVIPKKNIHNWGKVEEELITKYKNEISIDESLGAVSLIGEGFSRDNAIIVETINLLNSKKIEYFGLTTTSFRLSVLVKKEILNSAVEILHNYWIK